MSAPSRPRRAEKGARPPMKRLTALCLSAALLCGLLLPAASAAAPTAGGSAPASTGTPSAWANDEVYRALELEFVPTSIQDDYQKEITRAEFAEIAIYFLATQFGYPATTEGSLGTGVNYQVEDFLTDYCDSHNDRTGAPFNLSVYGPNVSNSTFRWWAAFATQKRFTDVDVLDTNTRGFVNAAYALGIVNGTNESATLFNPNGSITRQEAATILQRTYACYASSVPTASGLTYADKGSIADWAASSVALMTQWGVMGGTGDNKFDPMGTYTREQCIVTFMRLYDKAPEGRAKGTVSPMFTQAENVQRMEKLGTFGTSLLYKAEAPDCIAYYIGYLGWRPSETTGRRTLYNYSVFRILYEDGTYRSVGLEQGYGLEFRLSDDGKAVNFVRSIGGIPMSIDLSTGEISNGFHLS